MKLCLSTKNQEMRNLLFIILICFANSLTAQTIAEKPTGERKGFIFGLGIGAGVLTLQTHDTTQVGFSTSLPNIKIGYLLNKKIAFFALLPGATYQQAGKTRGFEGIQLACQYWIKEKWWLMGGTGLTFDAPAFYTVKDPKTAEFYTGFPSYSFATGYECWRKGRFAIDIQYRIYMGKSNLLNNVERLGISNMFIFGFNWY